MQESINEYVWYTITYTASKNSYVDTSVDGDTETKNVSSKQKSSDIHDNIARMTAR